MQDLSWNSGKKFMGNVDQFLKSLTTFDKDNVPVNCVERVSLAAWAIPVCQSAHAPCGLIMSVAATSTASKPAKAGVLN